MKTNGIIDINNPDLKNENGIVFFYEDEKLIAVNFIESCKRGGGTNLVKELEKIAKSKNKRLTFPTVINIKLVRILMKRNYKLYEGTCEGGIYTYWERKEEDLI